MSRTIRRMPFGTKSKVKIYSTVQAYTKPDPRLSLYHYVKNDVKWSVDMLNVFKNVDPSFYEIVTENDTNYYGMYTYIRIKETFSIKETYEEKVKHFNDEVLEYAYKNGTCKRQRMHAAKLAKKNASRILRAKLKRELYKEINDYEKMAGQASFELANAFAGV